MAKAKSKQPTDLSVDIKPLMKQLSKEKDLEPEVIKFAIESAILSAAQKRQKMFTNARPDVNIDDGKLRLYVTKKVVVHVADDRHELDILEAKKINPKHMLGQEVEVEIGAEEFGRIAAQSVRQGILQRLRDAERDRVYADYKDKVGQVVTGIVQRYERRDCLVLLNKVECLLPHQEIPMGVRYKFNDRVRCLIVDVRRTPKGPQVILSRTRSELVKQLFAMEVPEISDGTVRIVEIAREPGIRTKIAVQSMDLNVDPVGACVGMKGSRVQMIVRELDNEKIDIVPFSMNATTFITSALNPAQIVSIRMNEIEKRAEVVVERETLSRAIGKRGQNAKLAAKLTGWKIDISEQEEAETLARIEQLNLRYLSDFLAQVEGLSEIAAAAIARAPDFNSVEKLADADPKSLYNFTNDNAELAAQIVNGAEEYLDGLSEIQNTGETDAEMPAEQQEFLKRAEDMANRLAGRASFAPDDLVKDLPVNTEGGAPALTAAQEEIGEPEE